VTDDTTGQSTNLATKHWQNSIQGGW
jgi:hypothetical protein